MSSIYRISVNTNKFPEGYFWCILANDCNCGFGYSESMDQAFADAKAYFEKNINEKDNI